MTSFIIKYPCLIFSNSTAQGVLCMEQVLMKMQQTFISNQCFSFGVVTLEGSKIIPVMTLSNASDIPKKTSLISQLFPT